MTHNRSLSATSILRESSRLFIALGDVGGERSLFGVTLDANR